ncbi:hypothetical protein B0H11DRAFT_1929964 [Mycena galericulata]|nr:hypothetical protein B0H11DRAFT_1929964 [Mycena galericulata]
MATELEEPTIRIQPGMEEGYASSPMAAIHREYLSPIGESHPSTYTSVQQLIAKSRLSKEDIWDRGRAADIVEGRTSHFIVDPEESCLTILRGATDLFQLEAAWDILRVRLRLGHKFFEKYTEEFKDKSAAPTSPASTNLALHSDLQATVSAESRFANYSSEFSSSLRASFLRRPKRSLEHSGSWKQATTVSREVQDAFPRRAVRAEDNPFIIHYDESGARIQMIPTGYGDQESTLDDSKVTRRPGQTEPTRYRKLPVNLDKPPDLFDLRPSAFGVGSQTFMEASRNIPRQSGPALRSNISDPGLQYRTGPGAGFRETGQQRDLIIEEIIHLDHRPNQIRQAQVPGVEEYLLQVAARPTAAARLMAAALLAAGALLAAADPLSEEAHQKVEGTVQGAVIMDQTHRDPQVLPAPLAHRAHLARQDLLAPVEMEEEALQ